MTKFRKALISPVTTVIAFVMAAVLLLFASIGGVRAALTYFSETYASHVEMYDIGVTLKENGSDVSWRNYGSRADGTWNENTGVLLAHMLDGGQKLQVNYPYVEELNVRNSGTINQYVRVTVYRYWVDNDGNKMQDLSPAMINLRFVNIDSAWLEDESARTAERTVLYYNRLLNAGDETPLFADRLTIDGAIARLYRVEEKKDGTLEAVYTYDGARFILEAKVDAVQENNAEDAVLSAWGKNVTVDPNAGTLRLK